jgi:hypothetical protein
VTVTPPPAQDGEQHEEPDNGEPVEAAKLVIDDEAFSASGGSPRKARCTKHPHRRCK